MDIGLDGWIIEQMDNWIDEWMDNWMDEWMDKWIGRYIDRCMDSLNPKTHISRLEQSIKTVFIVKEKHIGSAISQILRV